MATLITKRPGIYCALLLILVGCMGGRETALMWEYKALPDLSGLAWVGGDTLLAVHDAKNPFENDLPRASLLILPPIGGKLGWHPLDVAWPGGPSNDLESIARIPGTNRYLLVESGGDGLGTTRLFLAEFTGERLDILETVDWPRPIRNVEGAAVARAGDRLVFLYAERAHGMPSTQLAWAELTVDPLSFGPFQEVTLQNPLTPVGGTRTVSALDVDADGFIYTASAYDPDDDRGPFRSVVQRVGRVEAGPDGEPVVTLFPTPQPLATLDGLKVESLTLTITGNVAVGTDDELYGGILRILPPMP